ncbi:Wzz/FepE/Etk N-terminal domain-containing protein [Tenacibaculum ovolyticum]|uniref:Wzz/FepE/Etk N-terminal domain-containing protein n=1 Tax=Tenacibaculum ovolyticum TaxID=104270 RepID=UPI0007ED5D8C|nr:Wzz/FepE/Etk N-terminal domain-containing protein [Tenacibaculum ovolyticum]
MKEKEKIYDSEDEINLIELLKVIRDGRKIVVRFVIIFSLIGLFVAIFSEKQYTASTTLVPQTTKNKVGGNLSGLAAMAGINLGGGSRNENMSPHLYPKIVESIPFQKELLNVPLKFPDIEKKITYKEYYQKHKKTNVLSLIKSYTIGLPRKLLSLFKSKEIVLEKVVKDSIYRISIEDNTLFKQLQNQLTLDVNSKDRLIKVSFSMEEALASAQMTKKVKELLQKAIVNFKTQKAKDEFKFIEERYNELKKDFRIKQSILASFRDRNQGLITSRSQSRLERMESEYNLAYNIYSELAKQLETQKIKLKENTPVFTVIQPVSVPVIKSKPKRLLIFVVWLFLGVTLGIVFVFGKEWINRFKINSK